MSTPLVDQLLEANKAALAPVARLQELAADTVQKVVQHNLAVAQDYVELGSRQFQLLGEVNDPQKLVAEEGKLASEFGQKLVTRACEFFQLTKEAQNVFGNWAQDTARTAADSLTPKAAA